MLFARTKAIKNIVRMRKILNVLIKHGFGDFVEQIKLGKIITFSRFFKQTKESKISRPVRARLVLEELGSTFIKFGQILSTRVDILHPDWAVELKKLQDAVPPFPSEETIKVIESDLKAPLDHLFSSFERTPCASASIAQVHFAKLKDGKDVAVKVRRPGIEKTIEADLSILYTIVALVEKYIPVMRRYEPATIVSQFEKTITKELDFTVEGAHAGRLYRIFKDDDNVIIPKIYWKMTGKRVLTMDRLWGTDIDEVAIIRGKGIDLKAVAKNSIQAFFKQVFNYGYFHADLHPGNLMVSDDSKIIYLDFGIMGRIDDETRKYLAKMLFSLVKKDFRQMAKLHKEMGLINPDADLGAFEDELIEITEPIFGKPLNEINISELIMKLFSTAISFDMKLQPNLLLLQKSMIVIEGVGREFCPDLNVWEVAQPFIINWMKKELGPQKKLEEAREIAGNLIKAGSELPLHANEVLRTIADTGMKIDISDLEKLTKSHKSHGEDIFYGIIIGALIVGSFVVIDLNRGPRLFDISLFSIAGFTAAMFLFIVKMVKRK